MFDGWINEKQMNNLKLVGQFDGWTDQRIE